MPESIIPLIPALDIESEQQRLREQVRIGIDDLLRVNQEKFASLFNSIWKDPKLSPAQAFEAFGEQAGQLFIFAGEFQAFFNGISPGLCPQVPPLPFTIETSGHVTVG